MSVVIAVERGVIFDGKVGVQLGVGRILRLDVIVLAADAFHAGGSVETECHPTGVPLRGVVLEAVGHDGIGSHFRAVLNKDVAALERGHLYALGEGIACVTAKYDSVVAAIIVLRARGSSNEYCCQC